MRVSRHDRPQDPRPRLLGSSLLASTPNQPQRHRARWKTSARRRNAPPRGLHHPWLEGAASGICLRALDLRSPSRQDAIASCLLPLRTAPARRRYGHGPSALPAALRAELLLPRCCTRSHPYRSAVASLPRLQVCGQERRPVGSRRGQPPRGAQSGTRGIQGSGHRKWVRCRLSWRRLSKFPKSCATAEVRGCRRIEKLPEGRCAVGAST